ncbi:MAG: rod shape-determining protein, partial [Planctomycetes bacterium]|nr:rod shape-determining protein [Planctomycetota bacterium]MBM4084966.1 rod shape-determining protein [Planctomycetota bacterium]
REALRPPVESILEAIKTTLENTGPELASDLLERGMVLAGGGSLLRRIDKVIAQETGLTVKIADDPLTCVARGTGYLLENLDRYKEVLDTGEPE